jgi:hypothetical protein
MKVWGFMEIFAYVYSTSSPLLFVMTPGLNLIWVPETLMSDMLPFVICSASFSKFISYSFTPGSRSSLLIWEILTGLPDRIENCIACLIDA